MSECLLFGGQATASPRLFVTHDYCRGLKDWWRQICGGMRIPGPEVPELGSHGVG